MDLKLTDKVALVTGGGSGIGAATVRELAAEGVDVVVVYGHDATRAEQVAEDVRAAGRRAWVVRMDLGEAASVEAGVKQLGELGVSQVDIAVLCAGRNVVTPLEETSAEEWDAIVQVNLSGPFYLLKALRPLMPKGSAIVNVASVAGHTGAPHHAHYAAAKAGLINLTKSAARAFAPDVRVNCIAPGITLTEMGRDTTDNLPSDYASKKLLVDRFAEPWEIAQMIVCLASPMSRFMTGATIDVNGGRDLR